MKIWIWYVIALAFAAYWASNLILWYPWSYSPILGMTIMLTVNPVLWAYVTVLGIRSYPGQRVSAAVSLIAVVFLVLAIVADYLFFALIRGALEELYHPTTFYGYAFLVFWPVLIGSLFGKNMLKNPKPLNWENLAYVGAWGFGCMGIIAVIIWLDIKLF
ncbi:hypothetical protein [Marinimicrobium sp. ABcell2]|uniref:hypothetical protein n=1 Tax=Marinimicrobium sp. ABcell2 TaxID=3069751 RepID=UPI0027B0F589|nr:hypothetical protein [Marinimicrobium sp. ABcell2]MDQ2076257.1 hypothetical protein [Marinimicrobium sp. ABcell2]